MLGEIVGEIEYIHPYGKGFMIYTDKEWERGIVKLSDGVISVMGSSQIKIPISSVLSIDKSITLPARREGRALLLLEYANIYERTNVYLLLTGDENFIRKLRRTILTRIVVKTKIMYRIDGNWYHGVMAVGNSTIIFSGMKELSIDVPSVMEIQRRKITYGIRHIGVISIVYSDGEDKKTVDIFVHPLKRMFFWQLLNQVVDDYINGEIIKNLGNMERMVLYHLDRELSYDEIKSKLKVDEAMMKAIVDKLVQYGIVKRIVILRLTEKGKRVIERISEDTSQLS